MNTYMFDIICVTNRALCRGDFLVQIEKIASVRPSGIILREKELSEEEYRRLAVQTAAICGRHRVPCILHNFAGVAASLSCRKIHLPLSVLRSMDEAGKACFDTIGASCHSVEDAQEAERLGCSYVTVGHIFETECKKGLPGRGIRLLQEVLDCVSIPVYAIGGIRAENVKSIREAGARGACVMSGFMDCKDAEEYMGTFRRALGEKEEGF